MRLYFEDHLDYQLEAIEAVADLFRGQDINRTEFTVSRQVLPSGEAARPGRENSFLGIGNRLRLTDDEVLQNLRAIQLRNGLHPADSLDSCDFTVEMETGTGKTYVYLRTILELNKRYGFTKFIVVVPSVAIKEGVYKTLQITRDHFERRYPLAKGYEYFLYDSRKLGQVRIFATSSTIQIMVATVGAINKKDVNNLYKDSEKTGGEKPIDLVRATRPIIIVDEPQSVDGGLSGQGKKALDAMQPLCTLRYSATHVDKHHMVYRLDAVDAYERKLVKQVAVASLEIEETFNRPYVKLLSARNQRGTVTARVEIDVARRGKIHRASVTVTDGDDLERQTGRAVYTDCRIGTITCGKNNQSMEISGPDGDHILRPGEELCGANPQDRQRLMIRRTIKEHLEKEMRLAEQKLQVKVLSLFFIDSVKYYRQYDAHGNEAPGKYARMFEEEYRAMANQPEYRILFEKIDLDDHLSKVHNGYFSIDKKGSWTETAENTQANRDNAERAFNLIMKEKETLLSFESTLKFIFSHSALREGWDNPNVFQICALRDIGSERERRQTIGRGLRLCVDQAGKRLRGFGINTLTVIASESYEQFAETLQKEIEQDTGIRFGIVEKHQFATLVITGKDGVPSPLGMEKSEQLWDYLKDAHYIDDQGRVRDSLREAIQEHSLALPSGYAHQAEGIVHILRKLAGRLDIKNANRRRRVPTREVILEDQAFEALWNRIKYKTTFRLAFDNDKLIRDSADAIKNEPRMTRTRARFKMADVSIGKGGVAVKATSASGYNAIDEAEVELPDLLADLQEKTHLTRRSLVEILTQSRRLDDFMRNPQQFIDMAAKAINRTKKHVLMDGIRYQRVGDDHYYAQELFDKEELLGYLEDTVDPQKSAHERVVYDAARGERTFTAELDANPAVKVFARLPAWFAVPTPLGTYHPDWAVLVEIDYHERLYFVVETKDGHRLDDFRHHASHSMTCGRHHSDAIA